MYDDILELLGEAGEMTASEISLELNTSLQMVFVFLNHLVTVEKTIKVSGFGSYSLLEPK